MTHPLVTPDDIDTYARDGVVLIRGLFADHLDALARGIEANIAAPSEYGAENTRQGDTGRFFDDYCNWQRIPEFREVIETSPAAQVARDLMGSETVQLFHDHVLVKEPGTSRATPWHQDGPYYFIDGVQNVSFWSPLDAVTTAGLRCVAGSHRWPRRVMPTRWLSNDSFYPDPENWMPVPDPDVEGMDIREWQMAPGDAVAFHFNTLHGARGNTAQGRRRAFSLRLLGDDARYGARPGPTSPPFPGHDMTQGQPLRSDWFPQLLHTA